MKRKLKIPSFFLNVSIAMTAVLSLGSVSASAVETPFIPYDESEYENTTVNWEDFTYVEEGENSAESEDILPFIPEDEENIVEVNPADDSKSTQTTSATTVSTATVSTETKTTLEISVTSAVSETKVLSSNALTSYVSETESPTTTVSQTKTSSASIMNTNNPADNNSGMNPIAVGSVAGAILLAVGIGFVVLKKMKN